MSANIEQTQEMINSIRLLSDLGLIVRCIIRINPAGENEIILEACNNVKILESYWSLQRRDTGI